jgi:predicted metal-binding transcription factor (methanogenesis marker protein 9)
MKSFWALVFFGSIIWCCYTMHSLCVMPANPTVDMSQSYMVYDAKTPDLR